jgi:hypothetical protein
LIQQFDRQGIVSRLTLIREQLVGTQPPAPRLIELPDLLGEWQGEATIRYPGRDKIDQVATTQTMVVNSDHPDRSVILTQAIGTEITSSIFIIEADSNQLRLVNQSNQIMLLPTAAYTKSPVQIKPGETRSLEVGWSIAPNLRQRMLRNYSDQGDWLNVIFITESRVVS